METPFTIHKDNIWAVPALHYTMESAAAVCQAFHFIKPDCVAVELPQTLQEQFLSAAGRLPDISVLVSSSSTFSPLYYLCEPCDSAFEALRSALESNIPAFCVDLDVDYYPYLHEPLPDPYAISKIGLENYWLAYSHHRKELHLPVDEKRELHMARRLKELSLRYERILFVGGMYHIDKVLAATNLSAFPEFNSFKREAELYTLTEASCREVLPEGGYLAMAYERAREGFIKGLSLEFPPDRWKLLFDLYKVSSIPYAKAQGIPFPHYNLRNMMLFARNYAIIQERLTPSLFQLLVVARSCVDDNYGYEVWQEATAYPFLRNIDALPTIELSPNELWGQVKQLMFHFKQRYRKGSFTERWRKKQGQHRFTFNQNAPGFCSHQPEDIAIETFGHFLKKKGAQIVREKETRVIPFSSSLEDGIDIKETLHHWYDKQLYVKTTGKPPAPAGSVVMIFDPDLESDKGYQEERYPWKVTWHGEHHQESDMAFYSTPYGSDVIGPGISRCIYGGFLLSYPPRRLWDVWHDDDYAHCQSKAEVLLNAAIDYAFSSSIIYVASTPPRSLFKNYAQRIGKKLVYLPIGQISSLMINRLRTFHVLESKNHRAIADDYIY